MLLRTTFQSPSSSYLFSHSEEFFELKETWEVFKSFNRPQALTCFHTAADFNAGNLRLFKPQNTNLSF